MKKKRFVMLGLVAGLSVLSAVPAFAGEWKADTKGWWYQEDNGSYPVSTWKEINSKQYYFGADGYMLANTTTPDGYTVNADGAWTVNGIVQTKQVTADNTTTQTPQSGGAGSTNQQTSGGNGGGSTNPFAGAKPSGGGGKITLDPEAAARGHMY